MESQYPDIIVCAGDNVLVRDIERILAQHPAVSEVAVVGQPDPRWGEVPCAFILLAAQAPDTTAEDIIAFSRTLLTRFKVPKTVVFTELPKTPSGAIHRAALREQASKF